MFSDKFGTLTLRSKNLKTETCPFGNLKLRVGLETLKMALLKPNSAALILARIVLPDMYNICISIYDRGKKISELCKT